MSPRKRRVLEEFVKRELARDEAEAKRVNEALAPKPLTLADVGMSSSDFL